MDGFSKIDLTTRNKSTVSQDHVNTQPFSRMARKRKKFGLKPPRKKIWLGVLIFLFFVFLLPAGVVSGQALQTRNQAQKTFDAIKNQNVELASQELTKTKEELKKTDTRLTLFYYLKLVPIVNIYYNDAMSLMDGAQKGVEAGEIVLNSIKPYADVLGLKGQESFAEGSSEQRIKTAVLTMGKITPQIDEIYLKLEEAKADFDEVNPSHYPPFPKIGGRSPKEYARLLRTAGVDGADFVRDARPLIKVLPSLLGEKEEKKYLVLFQNDKELRPTGGFITAYAIFRVDQGIIHVDKSENIYNIDDTIEDKPRAPAPILKYLPNVTEFNLRDSNLSPDFLISMKEFQGLYEKVPEREEVDGIIAMDTSVLVNTIRVLDNNVQAGGKTFTADEDKRCDCPQVIYELEAEITKPLSIDIRYTDLEEVQARRKDIIGELMYAILEKALKSSPGQYWGPLMQVAFAEASQKHIMFYLFDKQAQQGIEALNAAGRIKAWEGDYLHINDTNFGGQKANLFTDVAVSQDYDVKRDGTIEKTINIEYKNPYPPSDCNLERGGLCLNAPLRNWLRVYVPEGSQIIESKGSEVKVTEYSDLGKTVFDAFFRVEPQGVHTFTVKYRLPFKLEEDSPLPLLIQKQPGTHGNLYTISKNGRGIEDEFPLLTDTEFELDL